MERDRAISEIFARYRDFGSWTGTRGVANRETPLAEQVQSIHENFPQVKQNDPGAWNEGGWKRVELEEAFSVLGLGGLE